MPAEFSGHFAFELCTALYLQTSLVGFEGLALQAKPRPAVCRRIPLSPPEHMPREGHCRLGGKRSPCGVRARDSKVGMSRRALSVSIRREA